MIIFRTNKPNILFINGFDSIGKEDIYNEIKRSLPGYKIFLAELDQTKPLQSFRNIRDFITKNKIEIVIGFSMGGFYTELLDNVYKKIFINPAFRFYELAKNYREKFRLNDKTINELKNLSDSYRFKNTDIKSIMIIGEKDEKIIKSGAIEDYKDNYKNGEILYFDGKHVIDSISIHQLIPIAIKKLLRK